VKKTSLALRALRAYVYKMTPRCAFHASSFVLKMKSSVLLWFAGYSNNYGYMVISSVNEKYPN